MVRPRKQQRRASDEQIAKHDDAAAARPAPPPWRRKVVYLDEMDEYRERQHYGPRSYHKRQEEWMLRWS
jgi:hypothetical protein